MVRVLRGVCISEQVHNIKKTLELEAYVTTPPPIRHSCQKQVTEILPSSMIILYILLYFHLVCWKKVIFGGVWVAFILDFVEVCNTSKRGYVLGG